MMIQKISRFGSYGILMVNHEILLTIKPAGIYQGLFDLPGGGIEFKESPEEALKREFLEEVAIEPTQFELFFVGTAYGEYLKNGSTIAFHQIGFIYKIIAFEKKEHLPCEEEQILLPLEKIQLSQLTPLAKQAISKLKNLPYDFPIQVNNTTSPPSEELI
jgi:8-oxo-dGTP pyrophosphatase MutT (NUDIX family)